MESFTPKEMCAAVYLLSMNWATGTAKDLIKTMTFENKIIEEEKLTFDLSIAFIFMASTCVCDNPRWDKAFQTELMDCVCALFFSDLNDYSMKNLKHNIKVGFFVRDKGEREFVRKEFQQITGKDENIDALGTNLYGLATILFNKRFSEYHELWKLDVENMFKQGGFIPAMPQKVYEHWSGKNSRTHPGESLAFSIPLYATLGKFSLELSKQLSKMVIK